MRAEGKTASDALTKATLDNYGVDALKIIPILNAIDLIATTPDLILETFGVDKEAWIRKKVTEGLIKQFAPSGVVEQTTDLMVHDNWSDIGNALAYGWGKVKSADGVLNTVGESAKLVAGTIGAVPVAIARGISETVDNGIFIVSFAIDGVSNLFTW